MFVTRNQTREQVREFGTWVAAALLGAGVGLSITVVFLPAGMGLIILGAFVGVIGWAASLIIPACFHYLDIKCPNCHQVNQVRITAVEYRCEGCGRKLRGAGFWRRGKRTKELGEQRGLRLTRKFGEGA